MRNACSVACTGVLKTDLCTGGGAEHEQCNFLGDVWEMGVLGEAMPGLPNHNAHADQIRLAAVHLTNSRLLNEVPQPNLVHAIGRADVSDRQAQTLDVVPPSLWWHVVQGSWMVSQIWVKAAGGCSLLSAAMERARRHPENLSKTLAPRCGYSRSGYLASTPTRTPALNQKYDEMSGTMHIMLALCMWHR